MREPKAGYLDKGQKRVSQTLHVKKTRLTKGTAVIVAKKTKKFSVGFEKIEASSEKPAGIVLVKRHRRVSVNEGSFFPSTHIVTRFRNAEGHFAVDDVADWFGMSQGQLAETVGVKPETFHRVARVTAAKTQSRLKEMLEIVGRVAEWAGGKDQAMAWYRAEPIPEFGGRTAESLVKDGKATDVRDFLDHVALGGFT